MSAESARTIALPSGEEIAALGQGTWYLGEDQPGVNRRSPRCGWAWIWA